MKKSHKSRKTQKKKEKPGGIFLLSVLLPGKNHKLAIQLFSNFCVPERALWVRGRVPGRAQFASRTRCVAWHECTYAVMHVNMNLSRQFF